MNRIYLNLLTSLILLFSLLDTSNSIGNDNLIHPLSLIEDKDSIGTQITPHIPISIDGDADLHAQAYNEGWDLGGTQDGSFEKPYYIENYNISDYDGTAISVKNTASYLIIRRNLIDNNSNSGIYLENVKNTSVYENSLDTAGFGIRLIDSSYNYIWNNTLIVQGHGYYGVPHPYGIYLINSDFNAIAINSINRSTFRLTNGIFLDKAASNKVLYNKLEGNGNALVLRPESNFNSIHQNYVFNATVGLSIGSNNNFFSNNKIMNCENEGLILSENASFNRIRNNTIDNSGYGLYFSGENNNENLLYANNVTNTDNYGLIIESNSNDNLITWNNFIGNAGIQGLDNGTSNIISRNHWSELSGPDVNPIDDFVDIEYFLNGSAGTTDSYPLVNPYVLSGGGFIYPGIFEVVEGEITVSWNPIFDNYGNEFLYNLYYAPDGYEINLIANGLTTSSFQWDSTLYDNGQRAAMLVVAHSENTSGFGWWSPGIFSVQNHFLSKPSLLDPTPLAKISGEYYITWESSIDSKDHAIYYDVYFANENFEWITLLIGTGSNEYTWDTTRLNDGFYYLKIVASDEFGSTSEYVSEEFIIDNFDDTTTTPIVTYTESETYETLSNNPSINTNEPTVSSSKSTLNVNFSNILWIALPLSIITYLNRKRITTTY
ncbi:MAG: right-handed parallel beta-helix repeat-containing protein [Candidatus Kariarchaeaceae archaeon]